MKRDRARHPAADCTKAQREAFELIAIRSSRPINKAVIRRLVDKELVQEHPWSPVCRDRYMIAGELHAQWCAWAAVNSSERHERFCQRCKVVDLSWPVDEFPSGDVRAFIIRRAGK